MKKRKILLILLVGIFLCGLVSASECDSPDPAWYFCSDWESGGVLDGGKWSDTRVAPGTGDTVELTTNPPAGGPGGNALEVHWHAYASQDAENYVEKTFGSFPWTNPYYSRLYFYSGDPSEYPGAGGRKFMLFRANDCSAGVSLYLYSAPGSKDARLHAKNHAAGDCYPYNTLECEHLDGTYPWPGQEDVGIINANQWYSIEFATYRHSSLGWVRAWLDGKLVINATGTPSNPMDTNEGCGFPDWLKVPSYRNEGSPSDHYEYIDNVIFSGSYIGPEDQGPSTCPNGVCDSGETCVADSCCNGVTYNPSIQGCCNGVIYSLSTQVCCSGTTHIGDCCGDTDCTSPETCENNVCILPSPECSDGVDNDGDEYTDLVDVGCDNATDMDETNCGDLVCEGGEICNVCVDDCGTCPIEDIVVDSTYLGYNTSVIDDNIIDAYGGTATTWASASNSTQPHWVAINFSQSRDINNVTIYWAYNNQQSMFMSSQEVQVQYWDGSQYLIAATITNGEEPQSSSSVTFPEVTTNSLRFYQPANMGHVTYTTVIWLTEIDYSSQQTYHEADNNPQDGCIDMIELIAYIGRWKNNDGVDMINLIEAIGIWKVGGC